MGCSPQGRKESDTTEQLNNNRGPHLGFPGGASGKEPTCQCRRHKKMGIRYLGREDPLEKVMTTRSSILAWRIPWTEEPGELVHGVTESDTAEVT